MINLLGISIGDLAKLRLQVGAGASMNLETSFELSGSISDAENTKNAYWNGIAGFGVDVMRLTADIRYSKSFGDIVKGDDIDLTPSAVFFTIGYKFR